MTPSSRLCPSTRASPKAAIAARGRWISPARIIIDAPITQITWATSPIAIRVVKYQPKVMTVSSSRMSQSPRVRRKRASSPRVRRVPAIQALAPARKTKVGAQKWVIQRVANRAASVRVRSVGSNRASVR